MRYPLDPSGVPSWFPHDARTHPHAMNSRFYRMLIAMIGTLALGWLAVAEAPEGQRIVGALIVLIAGAGLAKTALQVPPGTTDQAAGLAEALVSRNKQLEDQLRESESHHQTLEHYFETLMAHVPANIYFKDTESRFLMVNQSMADRVKMSHPSDLIGKTDHDIFGAEHADPARADEERIIRTGKPITGLIEWEVFPDGKEGWVLTNKMPFRDKNGKIIGTFGMSSEVDELIETQHQLERERNVLRSLIDSFPDQIFVRDKDRRYSVVNKAMAEWVGAESVESMIGKLPEEFYSTEVAERSREEDLRVLATGEPVMNRENTSVVRKTGESRIFITTKVPLLDAEGKRWGIVGMIRDVTEQRRSREKLIQSERRMQDMIDNSPAVISLKDLNGTYLMVNVGFETMFGLNRQDILGRTDHDFIADKRAADRFRQHDLMVIERNEVLQVDEELMVDGELRTYVAVRFPIRDLNGKVVAVGGISTDITDRKEAEEAMRTLNSELSAANETLKSAQEQLIHAEKMESIGRLAAGVAHEVKNPLAMIGMGLEILNRRIPDDDVKGRETIDRMKRGIDRAKKIVKGLVDYSSARQLSLEKSNLNEVVRDAISLTDYPLRKGGVILHTDLSPDLPPVDLDATKMEQVLVNLMINAMHAMPDGGDLTIRTFHESASGVDRDEGTRTAGHLREGDHVVKIQIADNGTGISEENLKKLFDPFFTTKATGTGTGLGLAVSRKIVELHRGQLTLENRPGGGVLATISLKSSANSPATPLPEKTDPD